MTVKGNSFFYESVTRDPRRTFESVALAVTSSLVMGLGLMLVGTVTPQVWLVGALVWAGAVLGLGAGLITVLGPVSGGGATYTQVARGLGYAVVPQTLAFLPVANFMPGFVIGSIWAGYCSMVAVREAHHIPTRNAVILIAVPVLLAIGAMPIVLLVTGSG